MRINIEILLVILCISGISNTTENFMNELCRLCLCGPGAAAQQRLMGMSSSTSSGESPGHPRGGRHPFGRFLCPLGCSVETNGGESVLTLIAGDKVYARMLQDTLGPRILPARSSGRVLMQKVAP